MISFYDGYCPLLFVMAIYLTLNDRFKHYYFIQGRYILTIAIIEQESLNSETAACIYCTGVFWTMR